MKQTIERIFSTYRKHKYYTLFMSDYNINVTSYIDEVGGGKGNKVSDPTGNVATNLADELKEAQEFVDRVENAVDQLPYIERQLIQERYMTKDHDYINDYTVYELKLYISAPYYYKIRERAFQKLFRLLSV